MKKIVLSALAICAGLALFAFVFLSGEGVPRSVNGLCSGLGGALIGLGGASVAIRCHAAYDCWYWSLYLLWVPFVIALMQGELLWMVLCPAVIVLHCAFYMLHIHRWSKKL